MPTMPGGPFICRVDALEDGEIAEFVVDGRTVALARVDGQFHALDNVCPHAGGPLGDGELEGHIVHCPWHGWGFDVTTGACQLEADCDVPTVPVEVRDGSVWLKAENQ